MRFADTNLLLYAALPDAGDAKAQSALDLLAQGDLAISVQVLQEFYTQATRPSRPGALTSHEAFRFIHGIRDFPIQDMTPELFRDAIAIHRRFQISYWDGAILAATRALGCDIVYSEDFSTGQDYDGIAW